jgi:hypothetical protein
MTLYATSNVVATTVPAENGGCGTEHRRPVISGAPQHPWGLVCPPCEDFLRKNNSDQWSITTSEIPETYDEKLAREDFDRRGAKDKDAILTLALARLAGIDSSELPESLTRMISGVPAHVPVQGKIVCGECGSDSAAGMKFCGQCGSLMSPLATKAAIGGPQRPAEPPAPAPVAQHRAGPVRLQDLRGDELRAACRARGLADEGVRKDLMKRLRGAGVSNADLQKLLLVAA